MRLYELRRDRMTPTQAEWGKIKTTLVESGPLGEIKWMAVSRQSLFLLIWCALIDVYVHCGQYAHSYPPKNPAMTRLSSMASC